MEPQGISSHKIKLITFCLVSIRQLISWQDWVFCTSQEILLPKWVNKKLSMSQVRLKKTLLNSLCHLATMYVWQTDRENAHSNNNQTSSLHKALLLTNTNCQLCIVIVDHPQRLCTNVTRPDMTSSHYKQLMYKELTCSSGLAIRRQLCNEQRKQKQRNL